MTAANITPSRRRRPPTATSPAGEPRKVPEPTPTSELVDLQQQWLAQSGLPPDADRPDLTELPGDTDDEMSWQTWAAIGPGLISEDASLDTALRQLDAWDAERQRRVNLVAHATALRRWHKSTGDVAANDAALDSLPARLSAEHARRDEAWQAERALQELNAVPPKRARASARFTLRCQDNCLLATVHERRLHADDPAPRLLVIAFVHRRKPSAAWLAELPNVSPVRTSLAIGCPHGAGRFPTGVPLDLDRAGRLTRRVDDMPSVSWRYKGKFASMLPATT